MRFFIRSAIFGAAMVMALPSLAATLSEVERSALHAAMVSHIDRQAVSGMYLQVDLKSGTVNKFAPAKSHAMILTMGDNFVLCTDFKDEQGTATNVDFYVVRKGKSFAVFHTEINNRDPLKKLMDEGKVQPVD